MWYRRSLVLVLASALTACASAGHSATSAGTVARAPVKAAAVKVNVQNDNFYDVVVYAVVSGVKTRLGSVVGHSKQLLRVPVSLLSLGSLQIFADPIGGERGTVLEPIAVSPGQQVSVTLMPSLNMSYVSVR
ncbi:MAG TPA: hypothetical protein VGD77_17270 [Gemmatimonadaceae bacterium]